MYNHDHSTDSTITNTIMGYTWKEIGLKWITYVFADDIILFSSGSLKTLKLIMKALNSYQDTSSHFSNRDKIHFMVHSNSFINTKERIKRITRYLGWPLFVGIPRIIYFSNLINNVLCRMTGYQTKLLSYGGRAILVKHVSQALPIPLLSIVTLPLALYLKKFKPLWCISSRGGDKRRKILLGFLEES